MENERNWERKFKKLISLLKQWDNSKSFQQNVIVSIVLPFNIDIDVDVFL